MKIATSLFYLFFLVIFPQILPAQKNAEKSLPDLDGYIAKVLKVFDVPGVSLSIVKDGKVVLAKGYGIKKVGEKSLVDEHTLFSIASNSKAFTTTALAILVEDGKLKWDDPLINYLPWFKMADSYVTTHLTVRDLLVHRSGLQGYAGDLMLFPPSSFSRKEIIQKIAILPLKYDFRTTYAYDNVLYVTAGELISVVSGMPYEEFIQTRIFDKIGMGESLSKFTKFKDHVNIATGHKRIDNKVRAIENFPNQMIGDAGNAAGGIVTNARDMAQWLITQLDSGRAANQTTIFSPASTKELWKVITPIPVGTVDESLKPMQYNFHGYSPGFRISNYKQYKLVGHGGALDGFVSHVMMVPDLKLGISVFTNQESTGAYNAIIYHILDYYMKFPTFDWIAGYKTQLVSSIERKAVQKQRNIIQPVSGTKPSLSIAKYTGVFTDQLIGDLNISLNNGKMILRFEQSPQLIADLEYFQYNTFLAKFRNHDFKADSYVTFLIGPSGEVDEVKLSIIDPDSDLDFGSLKFKPTKATHSTSSLLNIDTIQMKKEILAEFAKQPSGEFAVAFKDISTGQELLINAHENFHAASTMKTPILIETFKQAAEGKFQLTDSMLIHKDFKSIVDGSIYSLDSAEDSEKELYSLVGKKLPIKDILFKMITKSSNLSTNLVVDLVDAKNANKTMRSLGAKDIQVLRGVEDNKAYDLGLNNTVTAYDLMLIFEHLANETVVSKKACDEMIEILEAQYFRDIIPAKLPRGIRTATKSGSITKICHDSGIVFLPGGKKYVVVLLSRGVEDQNASTETLATVSRIIYDHVVEH